MTPSEAVRFLISTGLNENAIAAAVGSTQPTINRIRRDDMRPNYDIGKALVDLAVTRAAQAGQSAA